MSKPVLLSAAAILSLSATVALAQDQAGDLGGLRFSETTPIAAEMTRQDDFTIVGTEDLMQLPALTEAGTVRAIVEIPTGTSAKWEVSKDDPRAVYWEYRNDAPRVVNYLGYPGNYGSIPGTALPKELGGDGDPLDVIVLGQAAPRGAVVEVKVIGVLKMLDGGEQDDKLIAVMAEGSPLSGVDGMDQLAAEYPGAREIVELFFTNYKGPDGGMEAQGVEGAETARSVLEAAAANFAAQN